MTHSTTHPLPKTVLVTGASRGFGLAVAAAYAAQGARVIGVARDADRLAAVRDRLGDTFTPVVGDAAEPETADRLLTEYRPDVLVLNAGAEPVCVPLQEHTWETFSRNWHVDVRQAFHWARRALLLPLEPGATVVALSSGAALRGSPLSGGYAGAKSTVRFVAAYAAEESRRADLGIRFVSLLPQLTPATDLGLAAARAYAAYAAGEGRGGGAVSGTPVPGRSPGAELTPEVVAAAVLGVVADAVPAEAYFVGVEGAASL
jgi:NAD(P)-dependent dehydrogenase (short-subunit alcohol dehydrogenase family)